MASLFLAQPSQARVVAGHVDDPADDLIQGYGDSFPDPPTNFTSMSLSYDSVGRVEVAFTLTGAPAWQGFTGSAGLGFLRPDGSCDMPFFISNGWRVGTGDFRGQAAVYGSPPGGSFHEGTLWLPPDNEQSWFAPPHANISEGPNPRLTFVAENALLRDRGYTCAAGYLIVSGGNGLGEDNSRVFSLRPTSDDGGGPGGQPGHCSKRKGKERGACIKKRCGRLKGKKKRACIKKATGGNKR